MPQNTALSALTLPCLLFVTCSFVIHLNASWAFSFSHLLVSLYTLDGGGGTADEGYGGPEEEEEAEGGPRTVRTFAQAMRLCAARLTEPRGAQTHYQAVCRALFVETLELRAFLARVREAKEVS